MPFSYERLPSTKQPFWNSLTNIFFQTIYTLEQKLDGRLHATFRLRNSYIIPIALHIKDCQALNSHLIILQTSSSSKPYILLSRNLMGGSRQISYTKKLNFIPLRSQRGSSINHHLGILQTISSSKPYIFLSINLMGGF